MGGLAIALAAFFEMIREARPKRRPMGSGADIGKLFGLPQQIHAWVIRCAFDCVSGKWVTRQFELHHAEIIPATTRWTPEEQAKSPCRIY
jgi:hypothetical protein